MAAERVRAQIVHETDRRIRLRAPALRGDEEACRNLELGLRAAPELGLVEVKPMTGSVVIASEAGRAAILKVIKPLIEVRKVAPKQAPPARPTARAAEYFDKMHKGLLQASGGRLGVEDAAFVLFCVGAVIQLARGRFASPATALLWSAIALANGAQRRSVAD
jgi:hypothetical protein